MTGERPVAQIERALSEHDIAVISEMHKSCLPTATVSLLGMSYLRKLYRYIDRSNDEILIVSRLNGEIAGVSMISLARGSLGLRLLRHTSIGLQLLLNIWRFEVLRAVWQGVGDLKIEVPEVVFFFVDATARRQGVATDLIAAGEIALGDRGIDRYGLRTDDNPDGPAHRLYIGTGFERMHRFDTADGRFVWLEKSILP